MSDSMDENTCKCSHLGETGYIYAIISFDGKHYLLCRACYGDITRQILDKLISIKVKTK